MDPVTILALAAFVVLVLDLALRVLVIHKLRDKLCFSREDAVLAAGARDEAWKALDAMGFKLKDAALVANRTWGAKELAVARLMVIKKVANGDMDPEIRDTLPTFDILDQ